MARQKRHRGSCHRRASRPTQPLFGGLIHVSHFLAICIPSRPRQPHFGRVSASPPRNQDAFSKKQAVQKRQRRQKSRLPPRNLRPISKSFRTQKMAILMPNVKCACKDVLHLREVARPPETMCRNKKALDSNHRFHFDWKHEGYSSKRGYHRHCGTDNHRM